MSAEKKYRRGDVVERANGEKWIVVSIANLVSSFPTLLRKGERTAAMKSAHVFRDWLAYNPSRHDQIRTLLKQTQGRIEFHGPPQASIVSTILLLAEESAEQAQRLDALESAFATVAEQSFQTDYRISRRVEALEHKERENDSRIRELQRRPIG